MTDNGGGLNLGRLRSIKCKQVRCPAAVAKKFCAAIEPETLREGVAAVLDPTWRKLSWLGEWQC